MPHSTFRGLFTVSVNTSNTLYANYTQNFVYTIFTLERLQLSEKLYSVFDFCKYDFSPLICVLPSQFTIFSALSIFFSTIDTTRCVFLNYWFFHSIQSIDQARPYCNVSYVSISMKDYENGLICSLLSMSGVFVHLLVNDTIRLKKTQPHQTPFRFSLFFFDYFFDTCLFGRLLRENLHFDFVFYMCSAPSVTHVF